MLIIFKSKAAAEIIMYEKHAKPLLDLLNKDIKRGTISALEMANAITLLEEMINSQGAQYTPDAVENLPNQNTDHKYEEESDRQEPIRLGTRMYPLLEMLRAAKQDNQPVVWGV